MRYAPLTYLEVSIVAGFVFAVIFGVSLLTHKNAALGFLLAVLCSAPIVGLGAYLIERDRPAD